MNTGGPAPQQSSHRSLVTYLSVNQLILHWLREDYGCSVLWSTFKRKVSFKLGQFINPCACMHIREINLQLGSVSLTQMACIGRIPASMQRYAQYFLYVFVLTCPYSPALCLACAESDNAQHFLQCKLGLQNSKVAKKAPHHATSQTGHG